MLQWHFKRFICLHLQLSFTKPVHKTANYSTKWSNFNYHRCDASQSFNNHFPSENLIEMKNPKHFPLKWVFNEPFSSWNSGFFHESVKTKANKAKCERFFKHFARKNCYKYDRNLSWDAAKHIEEKRWQRKIQWVKDNLMEKL